MTSFSVAFVLFVDGGANFFINGSSPRRRGFLFSREFFLTGAARAAD